ncbi:glycosyltransferase [Mycobacterium sp. KBS0706]|uniref:glycosyltransferase n=1 Tax=Mycobacterium sp. KBS0706 TaxID=2578109 RepID=UPI00163DDD3D|nr:glycosyltransferase [Mycobacterium sp. KBS0706]
MLHRRIRLQPDRPAAAQPSQAPGRIKVAHLMPTVSLSDGGPPTALRLLCDATQRSPAISLEVFALERDAEVDRQGWGDVPIHLAPVRGPKSFGYSRSLQAALRESDADLLHVHGLWMYTSIVAVQWAAHTRKPYLLSPHGMLDPWALANRGWKKRIAMRLYEDAHLRGASCLHALCDSEAQSIRALGLTAPICRIPNGAILPDGVPPQPEWRKRLPADARILLYLGRLTPKKGPGPLIRAWAGLRPTAPASSPWHLVFVGGGPEAYCAEIEALAVSLGVGETVHFVGPQYGPDKAAALASADAFILPSFSEGMPNAALEAWAHGLPSLLTPQCNLPEGFEHGAALSIDPNESAIANGIRRLMGMTDAERRAMGGRGRALVANRFSWPVVSSQFEAVYRWLLGFQAQPDIVDAV